MKINQGLMQPSVIQLDDHVRLPREDYINMVGLLERYRNFSKEFVYTCTCPRTVQDSMHFGKQYSDLDQDFKLMMADLGRCEEPIQIVAKKTAIPNADEISHQHQMRLLQQQQQREILNESPNQCHLQHNSNTGNGQHSSQLSFTNGNTMSTNHLVASSSGHSSTTNLHHHPNPNHPHLQSPHLVLSNVRPNVSPSPLTTTITLSTDPDDDEQLSSEVPLGQETSLNSQHSSTPKPQLNLSHSLNDVYIKSIQQQKTYLSPAQQMQRLMPQKYTIPAAILNHVNATQQNGQISMQANSIGNTNAHYPTIQNTSADSRIILRSMPASTSTSISVESTPTISSHTVASNGHDSVGVTSSSLTLPQQAQNALLVSQIRQQLQNSGQVQAGTSLIRIINSNGQVILAADGSQATLNGNLATTTNVMDQQQQQQVISHRSNQIRLPVVATTASTTTTSNGALSQHQPQPQHTFQTVEQLEATGFSPAPRQATTPQAHQPSSIRPSPESPGFARSGPPPSSAPTFSVIHPNQAYIISSSLAPLHQESTTSQNQHHLNGPSQQQPNISQVAPQGIISNRQTSPQSQSQSQQQRQQQQIMVYPAGSIASTPSSSRQRQQQLIKLSNGDTVPISSVIHLSNTSIANSEAQNGQQEASKSLVTTNGSPVVTTTTMVPSGQDLSPYLSSLVVSPGTPTSLSSNNPVNMLNLSSSSVSSSSSSSLNSLISKSLFLNQSSPDLAHFVLTPPNSQLHDETDRSLLLSCGISGPDSTGFWRCNFPDCVFTSAAQATFVSHIRRAHEVHRPYRCMHPGCDASFKEKYKLKVHRVVHTKEKPFKCSWPGCTARFSQSGHVSRHRRTHMEHAKFPCQWQGCTRAFIQKHTLKYHMMMHQGLKPWACPIEHCGRSFIEKWKLAKHIKSHNPVPRQEDSLEEKPQLVKLEPT